MPSPLAAMQSSGAGFAGSRTVLNVGCGHLHRRHLHRYFHGPEWREIRLDIDPAVRPDVISSIADMGAVMSASVDAIWSSHNLEHIHRHEVPTALREFLRVLKPTGLLLLTLPDLQQVAEVVAADQLEEQAYLSPSGPVTPLDMIYGHTPSLAQGYSYMAHKTGFTRRSLQKLLDDSGFVEAFVRRGNSFDLWATAYKPAD
jgi:predicted SAM-dependent methyltransferase